MIINLIDEGSRQPKYLQLVDTVRQAIRKGQLLAGDSLPSVRELSHNLHLNRHTVMKAFAELIAEGWIESKERVGYRVVTTLPVDSSYLAAVGDQSKTPPRKIEYRFVKAVSHQLAYSDSDYQYDFSGGRPDTALFPFAEFKSHMSDVLSRPDVRQLGYGESEGTPELIAEVKRYLRKARAIIDRDIVITNGSQEAIYIVAQLLLHAGDEVAVEALGYPPAMAAFASAGADLVAIQQDKNGIVPDDLVAKIQQGNIRLIYLTPLHQYPTTVTLTVSRRMAIYQLAATHGIPIIEDDYDHEFHYRCQPLAPMASQDPQQLVIYLSTFSKIMFPGTRIGFMALSASMAEAVKNYRVLINHKSNVFMQSALARWMKEGGFERHIRRTTRINQQRRDHAIAMLHEMDCFEFDTPDGGMALWLKIKKPTVSAAALAQQAQKIGIYIQHEGAYHLVAGDNQDCFIRVGFAGMNKADFSLGMRLLAALL
ncbi:transcriptional regulator, GntR family [gamma proteobacterium IMCC1989]|nr:transcriptional regulator, GntR family [gamma proteobacterium IMCC1989]